MSDNILNAVLTFSLLAGGTAAIGSDLDRRGVMEVIAVTGGAGERIAAARGKTPRHDILDI